MKAKHIMTALLLGIACVQASYAQNSATQSLFDKYADTDGVTTVYISKTMFDMMPVIVGNITGQFTSLKGKLTSLNVLNCDNASLIPQLRKEVSQLVRKGHQELMRVRDGKERTTFYAAMKGNRIDDLLMIIDSAESNDPDFSIIWVQGSFTLQDVQQLTEDAKDAEPAGVTGESD
ncbi:MAG: DUF4252 domain-containing protein [Prevotellaceae bacterium]|jgi:hypothetical protein|nr:DUF4252 domain-containing protein [Prevotellaceae bacterium]